MNPCFFKDKNYIRARMMHEGKQISYCSHQKIFCCCFGLGLLFNSCKADSQCLIQSRHMEHSISTNFSSIINYITVAPPPAPA